MTPYCPPPGPLISSLTTACRHEFNITDHPLSSISCRPGHPELCNNLNVILAVIGDSDTSLRLEARFLNPNCIHRKGPSLTQRKVPTLGLDGFEPQNGIHDYGGLGRLHYGCRQRAPPRFAGNRARHPGSRASISFWRFRLRYAATKNVGMWSKSQPW